MAVDFTVSFDLDMETYTFPSLGTVVCVGTTDGRDDPFVISKTVGDAP